MVVKLNPSHRRWAPPIHKAMGGHGFTTICPSDKQNNIL